MILTGFAGAVPVRRLERHPVAQAGAGRAARAGRAAPGREGGVPYLTYDLPDPKRSDRLRVRDGSGVGPGIPESPRSGAEPRPPGGLSRVARAGALPAGGIMSRWRDLSIETSMTPLLSLTL